MRFEEYFLSRKGAKAQRKRKANRHLYFSASLRLGERAFRFSGLASAAIAGMLLAGCAAGPDYQRPALELPAAWRAPAAGAQAAAAGER